MTVNSFFKPAVIIILESTRLYKDQLLPISLFSSEPYMILIGGHFAWAGHSKLRKPGEAVSLLSLGKAYPTAQAQRARCLHWG